MTPQLQQAIKLLQLSNPELDDFVAGEIEENPLLTREDGAETAPEGDVDGASTLDEAEATGPVDEVIGALTEDEAYPPASDEAADALGRAAAEESAPPHETDNDNLWNGGSHDASRALSATGSGPSAPPNGNRGTYGFAESGFDLADTLAEQISLRDAVTAQIVVEFAEPADRAIALALAEHLDEAGYLNVELEEIGHALGCNGRQLEDALARLQTLEPSGIFARDLRECLEIQLRDRDRFDPAMACLLANLNFLARGDVSRLQRLCGVDQDDLQDMILEIRALDPRPAAAFDGSPMQPLVPDVLMRPLPGPTGGWAVELNADALPRVLVDRSYLATVNAAARTAADRRFITENLQTANWLVRALDQRATTILKVSTEIVRLQNDFFIRGIKHLRPLVLRDVASAIDMHESTVSRATTNKYIATPRGIFELKYFFTSSITDSAGGSAHSAESVRQRIKTLIDAEPANKILSDDGLVSLLHRDGYGIARRTVAKYRETMRIPSSVERRRQKSLASALSDRAGG